MFYLLVLGHERKRLKNPAVERYKIEHRIATIVCYAVSLPSVFFGFT